MRTFPGVCFCVALVVGLTACGGASVDKPDTEQRVVSAFRSAGVRVPVVLHDGSSCSTKRPFEGFTGTDFLEYMYSCGHLRDLQITKNIPAAVLLVDNPSRLSNYLVAIYRTPAAAAADPFWAADFHARGSDAKAPYRFGPFHVLRKNNVAVSGFMRPGEIASAKRALARL